MKKIVSSFFVLSFLFPVFSFNIINPVEGNWANRQALVLDLELGEEAYYSLSGADPVTSGFVYDEPVLLDITGDIFLRLSVLYPSGERKEFAVRYKVNEPSSAEESDFRQFAKSVTANPVLDYISGQTISLPKSLRYCFGEKTDSWLSAEGLSINEAATVSRLVPCMVTDGERVCRFVINAKPAVPGTYSQREMPFELLDWETISLTDKKYIYKIDDGYWFQPAEPIKIDRKESHTVSWQSVAFSSGNPVQSFVLPPKPELDVRRENNGAFTVVADDRFRLCAQNAHEKNVQMFDAIKMDVFKGEHVSGFLKIGYYYDSIFQGWQEIEYNIDKKPPAMPVITPNTTERYARQNVSVRISVESGASVYVAAISKNISSSEISSTVPAGADDFANSLFAEVASEVTTIELVPTDSAIAYSLAAYAVDEFGNKSAMSFYDVAIDSYNFYVSEFADDDNADGSEARPFSSFEKCIEAARNSKLAHIFVDGTIVVNKNNVRIMSDCIVEGTDAKSQIVFEDSGLEVFGASLVIKNCIVSFESYGAYSHFIKLDDAMLSVSESEISAVAGAGGVLLNANSSVISVKESGLTISATNYANCIAATYSDIALENVRMSSSAPTSVSLSAQGGKTEMSSSVFYVTAKAGRVAEFFGTEADLRSNVYVPSISKLDESSVIFADKNSTVTDNGTNKIEAR